MAVAGERIRVLRIFHAGRDPGLRARDRALVAAGVDVVDVVPAAWPEPGAEDRLSAEAFPVVELDVARPGDVNRHAYRDPSAVARLVAERGIELVDLNEEPFSRVVAQILGVLPPDLPVVVYSAQNLDKRWPPPFAGFERRALGRVQGCYPCSRQAAAVLAGKGYGGLIEPLPLGYDEAVFHPGDRRPGDGPLRLALIGRLVAHKGVADAVEVLARLASRGIDATLSLVGDGPALAPAVDQAGRSGVGDRVRHLGWLAPSDLGDLLRSTDVLLAPSRSTVTWVEQFGRVITEAQASGAVVAGYDCGTISEVAGLPGIVVPEGDAASLAGAVAELVNTPALLDHRRTAGLARVPALTWGAVAARQVAFYREAAARPPGPWVDGSPRDRRRAATGTWGPPARVGGQARPFALPVLRRAHPATAALGRVFDAGAEVRAWAAGHRSSGPPGGPVVDRQEPGGRPLR